MSFIRDSPFVEDGTAAHPPLLFHAHKDEKKSRRLHSSPLKQVFLLLRGVYIWVVDCSAVVTALFGRSCGAPSLHWLGAQP